VAERVVWTEDSWNTISSILNDAYLSDKNKKNLRQLTKAEAFELETLKLDVLTNLNTFSNVNKSTIKDILIANKSIPKDFRDELNSRGITLDNMSLEKYRKNAIGLFIERNALFE
jgi:hypothetical protein